MILPLAVAALWSFAEGLLFFLVADVPIGWIALTRGWRAAFLAALLAAPAAALGGLAMLAWTYADPAGARAALVALPGIDAALVDAAARQWGAGHYVAMAQGSVSGVPYKLYAHAAAVAPAGGVPGFIVGSVAARLPRFVASALGTGAVNALLAPRLSLKARKVLFCALWAAFYAWYFARMPG